MSSNRGVATMVKIVGNLPYAISSPLLFKVLQDKDLFSLCVFLLQKEVAQRLGAHPGTKKYAPISILFQNDFEIRLHFLVPSSSASYPRDHYCQNRRWAWSHRVDTFSTVFFSSYSPTLHLKANQVTATAATTFPTKPLTVQKTEAPCSPPNVFLDLAFSSLGANQQRGQRSAQSTSSFIISF